MDTHGSCGYREVVNNCMIAMVRFRPLIWVLPYPNGLKWLLNVSSNCNPLLVFLILRPRSKCKKSAFELEFLTSFLVMTNHHLVPHLFSRRIPPEVNVVLG